MLTGLRETIQGKPVPFRRSSRWPKLRATILEDQKTCEACGRSKHLEVHHIKPFYLYPELELDLSNLIVLCEGSSCNCHFIFGHLLNWRSFNPSIIEDAEWFRLAVQNKPSLFSSSQSVLSSFFGRIS